MILSYSTYKNLSFKTPVSKTLKTSIPLSKVMDNKPQGTFDEKFFIQLEHRMRLAAKNNTDIEHIYTRQEKDSFEHEQQFTEELKQVKEEIQHIKELTHTLRKTIFTLGHQLKNKVTSRSVELVQEKIDAWPLEAYATKKEVPKLFEKYAKK
jgi:hypothetical protein